MSAARAGGPAPDPIPAAVPDSVARGLVQTAAAREGLRPSVLRTALAAYRHAVAEGVARRALLTVIDYSLPSHVKRLWVLDLARGRVLAREFVAHGRGTGDDEARRFSNRANSYESSLGTFVTGDTYDGSNGLSLRLAGLDPGLNDHAMERGIVMHGAWYVSRAMIARVGRLGRSEGCPALSEKAAPRIIHMIEGGSVLFAYYPAAALQRSLGTE
ncbi:MAG TPA: murein L,D-transpeptidase catalytic domain family protein [Gemmatimonadaceae bacterium]